MFPQTDPKQSFPALESEILAYWKANDTFKKSVESRPEENPYRFYDGPPFITGTPHYGSLLSSIVKDAVGRYWTMRGKRVERVWGWDCHGLPIEEKVQKKLGLSSNKEIEAHGVKEFIDGCYEYTRSTSAEWNWYVDKIGRWVDMDHAYRTMDQDYMESVMWVFKQLWDKGLVYEGKRVSLYSWKLSTPISNFEVAMDDTYQDVNDPAITVKFRPVVRPACGIIVENEKGEVLLGHNKKGFWSFPGGKNEEGETSEEAVMRELKEETGLELEVTAKDSKLEQYDFVNGVVYDNRVYHVKTSNVSVGNGEPEKFVEWKFFPKDSLPENTFDPSRYALEFISSGKIQKNLPISLLAWTTTPWTIPANMALAVGADIEYVLVENDGEQYVVAKNRVESVFKGKGDYAVIREFKGSELAGVSYVPPFPEYYHAKAGKKDHTVYVADFATDSDGTGIVHIAPEFGDVDFALAKTEGITVTEALDEAGKYTGEIFDSVGTHYQDANRINVERMKENGTLFKNESVTHRVPFCPRSNTPLIQKAQKSWFIDIQSQKEKLLRANEQINWFPEHLKFGRFAKGIESAPDWCVSRTRFWGAPMPVWVGADGEKLVVGSREEIFELNKPFGQLDRKESDGKIQYFFKGGEFDGTELNLHRPYVDAIKLRSPKTGNTLTRIPEVLDVWMDSGSMPYAQMHYPFENREAMERSFPADFIAEYVGQVRAWFYVMHTLGVLLNPKGTSIPTPSFTNVITTGIVNGSDGRKMSKSYGNYPDPRGTIEKYGADPIRFYMFNSPLLSGGNIDFKEEGIVETMKLVVLPFWNTLSFFTTYANADGWEPDGTCIDYMRHGQTPLNIPAADGNGERTISGGLNDHVLTEEGREQSRRMGRSIAERGKTYDVIVTTGMKRTIETAKIVAEEIGFSGEWVVEPRLAERLVNEKYDGALWTDVLSEYEAKFKETAPATLHTLTRLGGCESDESFCARVSSGYDEILRRFKGKSILIVAHGNVFRIVAHHALWIPFEEAIVSTNYRLKNAELVQLPVTPLRNPLDRFILGELQTLIAKVTDSFETYDLQRGARAIVDFLDDLTNWYVRRSRRRFWDSGMTDDKKAAYETLHRVLSDFSKVLAPYAPFISERVFQTLTRKESVHLEWFPNFERTAVSQGLLSDMKKAKNLVALGLALRSKAKIRVRQPLSKLIIGEKLDAYYLEILKEELNVKTIEVEDMGKIARKICKPNARLIGPRFWKDVQAVIVAAKSGDFVELENGRIQVGAFVLESGEFEIEYVPLDVSGLAVEGGFGTVVAMDVIVSDELRLEGAARDLVRVIQDSRKEAGYAVSDRILLCLEGEGASSVLTAHAEYLASETLSKIVTELPNADVSNVADTEIGAVTVRVKKA